MIPYLSSISIYETPLHFYLIGSDPSRTRYCTLKIDRSHETEFNVGEPDHEYTKSEVDELLSTISSSSIVTPSERWSSRPNPNPGLIRTLEKGWGIIGSVRFLEGYYLLVVTKARLAVTIGHHVIYKVEDVSMIYLPSSGAPVSADEQKYQKLFLTVDITSDFYFSYTYDLSRNMQENILKLKNITFNKNSYTPTTSHDSKFIWNEYLLNPFRKSKVSNKWTLKLVHGYVAYQIVELPCSTLTIALLARRSSQYAGTRFLKRGTNFEGQVANDVETEQIVWDMSSTPSLETGRFSSFVQRRGSVPLFWSQDPATRGMVGKPPIYVDLIEPNGLTTAAHFRELRRKYGHPVTVVNLVKRREKRHHENLLHEQFLKTVKYLNGFRKPGRKIDYISFDVAKCNKLGLVMPKLELLGLKVVQRTGWFQSFPQLKVHDIRVNSLMENFVALKNDDGQLVLQHGIIRTNCVDCLDRTNVAQYGIGRIALGFQLYSLGYVDDPILPINGELCRALEDLYDTHGDTMALQYAGSQLVHSIKTYKKTAAFQERSRDVIQTLSRYYSNTFNDFEKQNGINLFLGMFRPFERGNLPHLWDLSSDRYIHFPATISRQRQDEYLQWATNVTSDTEDESEESLSDWLKTKASDAGININNDTVINEPIQRIRPTDNVKYNSFDYTYRTFELTSLDQLLKDQTLKKPLLLSSLGEVGSRQNTFLKLFKSSEPVPTQNKNNAPSMEEDYDEEDEILDNEDLKTEENLNNFPVPLTFNQIVRTSTPPPRRTSRLNLGSGLKDSKTVYGFDWVKPLSSADIVKYQKYVQLSQQTQGSPLAESSLRSFSQLPPIFQFQKSFYTVDSVFSTELDEIPEHSLEMYRDIVNKKEFQPLPQALNMYRKYNISA